MHDRPSSVETPLVIRTYNESKHLERLFNSLDNQTYRNFETVVVDSGSTDHTRDIAAIRANKLIVIPKDDFTFGHSLNVGISAGGGSLIAMVSAHTIPCNDKWLECLLNPFRDNDTVAMTYGRQIGLACSKFSEVEDFERTFGPHPREEHRECFAVNNANSAIRKVLWERLPFDVLLPGLEDVGFAQHWMERGWRVIYEPTAALYHIHEESWQQIRHRYYREGIAWRQLSVKGWRSIPVELLKEASYTLLDIGRALRPGDNPVATRLTTGQRCREVLYYRLHKNIGTVTGLLRSRPIRSRAEREAFYFNRTIATVQEIQIPTHPQRRESDAGIKHSADAQEPTA